MPIAHSDWPRLLTLVDQALALTEADRPGWLHDLELPNSLKEALEGLLAQRRAIETGNFLGALPVLTHQASGQLAAGGRVGPWRLLNEVGQGGMSSVWLAERADDQMIRRVALKLPHAGPRQDVLAARLLRERDILAALEHPHIARLYDVGVTDAGMPFLVMEYVQGDTLLAHADAKRLSVAARLHLFQQVLRAVQYAHGKLVLHRDLKPNNILVTPEGEVKLLDFGIAKLLTTEGDTLGDTDLTRFAGRLLTPCYASPEQLQGLPLGTASDVYSLGVVLYELLCGRRPHAVEGGSQARLEDAVMTLEPKLPSRQCAAGLRTTLAGDLDAVVLKALEKTPERRYVSADALGADLARWLAGQPVIARVPSAWSHLAKFVKRHRLSVGLGAAAVVLLMVTSGVALVQARAARQEAARATAVRDFLVAMFNETDPDLTRGQELSAKTLLDNGRKRAAEGLAQNPELMAELLQYIGKAQYNLSDHTAADQTLAQAVETYRRTGNHHAELLALLSQADNALALGHHADAKAMLTRADELSAPYQNNVNVMGTLLQVRGYVAMYQEDWPFAKTSFEQYLALAEQRPDVPVVERVHVLKSLATVNSTFSNDFPGAMALIARADGLLRDHPEIPIAERMDLAQYRQNIEYIWGRYADIQRTSPQDVKDCDAALSPSASSCLKLRGRLQSAQLRLGLFEQALSINAALAPMLDPASPRDQAKAAVALARTLAFNGKLGERPELIRLLEQIAQPAPDSKPLDPLYRLRALNALTEVRVLMGQPAVALEWVAQASELAEAHKLAASADGRKLHLLEGAALQAQGQHERALAAMAGFCKEPEPPLGNSVVESHLLSLNCVMPLVGSGQTKAALALLDKALPVLRENLGAQAPVVRRAQEWLTLLRSSEGLHPPRTPAEALIT